MPYDSLTKKRENPCGLRCQEKKKNPVSQGGEKAERFIRVI